MSLQVSGRLQAGKNTLFLLWFLACRQVWRSDTVIEANEPFIRGDDVLTRYGVNIDDRGKGSHNNTSDHPSHPTALRGRKRPINY